MFDQAMAEFGQLTQITVAGEKAHSRRVVQVELHASSELEKNIQIQMNPFLVDKAVRQQNTRAYGKAGVSEGLQAVSQAMERVSVSEVPGSYSPIPLAFQQIEENPQASSPPVSYLKMKSHH